MREAARLVRDGKLVAIAGGGDTVAALNVAGVGKDFTYVSTAGGAFLEWLEGKTLPAVAALAENRAKDISAITALPSIGDRQAKPAGHERGSHGGPLGPRRHHHRAVDPLGRLRQARRGGAGHRRCRLRLDPCRRHGRPLRAEHHHRARRGEGAPAALEKDLRRASDDRALAIPSSRPSPRPGPTSSPCTPRLGPISTARFSSSGASARSAGVSITPSTHESAIEHVLDKVDLILVMTVNPGFGGQAFMPSADREDRGDPQDDRLASDPPRGRWRHQCRHRCARRQAGANAIVAGSGVFKGGVYADNIAAIRKNAERARAAAA